MFPDSLSNSPESICHQRGRSEEVYSRAEAASGKVALVLYGAVATTRRHILRHGGRLRVCMWLRLWLNGGLRSSERWYGERERQRRTGAGLGRLTSTNASIILLLLSGRVSNSMAALSDSQSLLHDMESEERPAKMRKLEHSEGASGASNADSTPDTTSAQQTSVTTQCGPVDNINGDDNANCTIVLPEEGQDSQPKISKNQLKKQRRHERWESGRDDRKAKRKLKIKEKKERRREAYAQASPDENGNRPRPPPIRPPRHSAGSGQQTPITVIFDCDFEDLMYDHELKSLGLQITRCYSDNRKAKFRTHLALANFGGKMKERFDGILAQQYTSWKGVRFFEEDFVAVAEKSKEWMTGPKGGDVAGALKPLPVEGDVAMHEPSEGASEEGEIVYLSSESENTLTHLKPNSTYIIGGLVDKNRHKGVCHKRAVSRGIKTAKLPIGEYLEMDSRKVLVTNHVLEIMLKWLEFGDWGKAFIEVMPKRKGGRLKGECDDGGSKARGDEEDEGADDGTGDGVHVAMQSEQAEPVAEPVAELAAS